MSSEIEATSARISELIIEKNAQHLKPWLRCIWGPDTSSLLSSLKKHRETLRTRAQKLAQARLKAEIEAKKAQTDHAKIAAEAKQAHDANLATANFRLVVIARARVMLSKVPALTYVGANKLLGYALRIENARKIGLDQEPGRSAVSR